MAQPKQMDQAPLEVLVVDIQRGDKEKQDYLLKTYQPFMVSVVSQVCKRYIDPLTDDEFSVGLSAFNDAIFLYSPEKGSSFLSFAKLIMTRKVIDYIRYQSRRQQAVSFEYFYDEEKMENAAEVSVVLEKYENERHAANLREEIVEYEQRLKEYNIGFTELTKIAPKHRDARETAIGIARKLAENEELRAHVQSKKRLPINQLLPLVSVSKKTLERNRKYILAMFIVMTGNHVYLKEYLKGVAY